MRIIFLAAALALASCASGGGGVTLGQVVAGARLAAAPGVSTAIADAPAGAYKMDAGHASVTWRVAHMGLSLYTGRFERMAGVLTLDPQNPVLSKIETTIEAKSVSTGHRDAQGQASFDAKIAKDAFGAETHPQIKFVSTSAVKKSDTAGTVTGDLTFNGVTKSVSMDVTFNGGRTHPFYNVYAIGFSGQTSIKRSEFGVTNWAGAVGDDVQILIEAEFLHQP
jgi:polyisoprenoid-binding protein YceI